MRNPVSKDTNQTGHGLFAVNQSRLLVMRESDPAAVEGRTRYPPTVVHIEDAQTSRPLISGHNNPKLGRLVKMGPWKGARIYHLSLEERATCPRTCNMCCDPKFHNSAIAFTLHGPKKRGPTK